MKKYVILLIGGLFIGPTVTYTLFDKNFWLVLLGLNLVYYAGELKGKEK